MPIVCSASSARLLIIFSVFSFSGSGLWVRSISMTSSRAEGRPSSGSRFLENLAYLVPGYRGYKEKELRREEDARLRGRVLAKFQIIRSLLEEKLTRIAESALDRSVELLDRRLRRTETLADAVRYAPYGFAGFFDSETVREETLEKLLEIDLLLFQDLDETVERIRGVPFPPRHDAGVEEFLRQLDEDLDRIEARLLTRDKVLGDG